MASGETRVGSVMPGVIPVHFRQTACSSQKPPILLRGVTCHVTRALAFSHVRSEYAGWLRSGGVHLVGSPVFRL
jgi:hypothetical protein